MNFNTSKIISFLGIFITCKLGFCQLTLEDIFLYKKYEPAQFDEIHFLNKSSQFAKLEQKKDIASIVYYNTQNKATDKILLKDIPCDNFSFSNTDKYILCQYNAHKIYRRAFEASYFLLDKTCNPELISSIKIMFPQFSPDDTKIAFILNNNIYYKDLNTKREVQVTTDGKKNALINGKSDWVYEEELELTQAFLWNAKGTHIAYLKFDETKVKEYTFPVYGDDSYPQNYTYKYPKAGEENSKVSLWVYDVLKKKNKQIVLPFTYEYIARLYWNNNGTEIWALTLNRHQNELKLSAYSIPTKKWRNCYTESSDTYTNLPKSILFLSDNSFFIPSEKDGYNHIYHYSADGKLLQQITNGTDNVVEMYYADEKTNTLYFQQQENDGIETALYSVNYTDLNKKKISVQNGYNSAQFSADGSFYFHTFSSSSIPTQISLCSVINNNLVLVVDNAQLQDSIRHIPTKQFTTIPVNGNMLNTYIIRPANFDSTKKYPLLMYVYGGPENIEVENKWLNSRSLWLNMMAEKGYFIVCVDNRGSGGKSAAFKKSTYLHLGKYETEDQIAAASYFAAQSYIDKNRIGIFGWSYGGFMAANCLFEGNTVFKAAIAVAPVSSWKLYDNIYTERYMRTPQENPKGYTEFCPTALASKLKGKLMLVHGTADDNVHFQNTVELINALQKYNKPFDLLIYPDKAHSISGSKIRYDLYTRMTDFILHNL